MVCRTLRLTEYQPREVRLRRADVDALFATGVFEVRPVEQPLRYRITAQGVAGVLLTPNLRIVIGPKIPKANLLLLLDPDAPPDTVSDATTPEPGTEAIDFLARQVAAAMRYQAAHGLSRAYVESTDRLPYLQGRLDVAAQARESRALRMQFHVSRDDFTADTPLHQLTKATAASVLASPFVFAATRAALQAALIGYAEVTSVKLDLHALDHLPVEQLDKPSQLLCDLCRMLAHGLRPGASSGAVTGPAFLLDLEQTFERYVEHGLRAHVPAALDTQPEFLYHKPAPPGQPPIIGRPDFVVRGNGRLTCVIDAKWKALDGPPAAADVHQVLAYAAGLDCKNVWLVYPGRRSTTWRYELSRSDVTLTLHTLRVVGTREKCDASMRRLARAIGAP